MGDTSGPLLVHQVSLGTRLIGPVATSSSWQQRAQQGCAPQDFTLDWQQQVARCPPGHPAQSWTQGQDKRGKPITVIQFAKAVCQACPVRSSCTRSPDGRSLTLAREPVQQALEQRRREQDKLHLHHLRIAAAINLVRIDRWLEAQEQGRPARRKRSLSRFGQLQQRKVS